MTLAVKMSIIMDNQLTSFDIVQYLDSSEAIAQYLSKILEDDNSAEFLEAIGHIAKAKEMAQISKDTGLGRESLYKTFASESNPSFDTVIKIMNTFGVKLQVSS